ncbi:MAG: methyltransferase domain-containing protein [Steroidobacteraceae bacterium]
MAVRPELLEILADPVSKAPLIDRGSDLFNPADGRSFTVDDGIPVFVDAATLGAEKVVLHDFYENFGWRRGEGGLYNSPATFGFRSPTLVRHRQESNAAQARWFNRGGRYFLDCASGAIPAEEYLEYSRGYGFHVCVDLTLSAVRGAREKLGERGLYVNADGTHLPFRDDAFDDILCSHTLYHMPRDEQAHALLEFHRVLKPGGRLVVFYNVGRHSMFGLALAPYFWLKDRLTSLRSALRRRRGRPVMYSHHYNASWFRRFAPPFGAVEIHGYRLLPNQVMKYLLPDTPIANAIGVRVLRGLRRLEQRDAWLERSQYVTIVFTK